MRKFKVGTYNVHGWEDKDYIDNIDRVKQM